MSNINNEKEINDRSLFITNYGIAFQEFVVRDINVRGYKSFRTYLYILTRLYYRIALYRHEYYHKRIKVYS